MSVVHFLEIERVGNDLHGTAIGFEFQEVCHNLGTSFIELILAEFCKILKPNLAYSQLNLLEGVVLHDFSKITNVHFCISFCSFGFFFKESSEIFANWKVTKD